MYFITPFAFLLCFLTFAPNSSSFAFLFSPLDSALPSYKISDPLQTAKMMEEKVIRIPASAHSLFLKVPPKGSNLDASPIDVLR